MSTYNVAPQQAGQYFNKIQCFCFEVRLVRPWWLRLVAMLARSRLSHSMVWEAPVCCPPPNPVLAPVMHLPNLQLLLPISTLPSFPKHLKGVIVAPACSLGTPCLSTLQEQKLRPGEKIDMPVFFYIDPEFATDPKMNGINIITLRQAVVAPCGMAQ